MHYFKILTDWPVWILFSEEVHGTNVGIKKEFQPTVRTLLSIVLRKINF